MKYTFTDGWSKYLNTHQASNQRKSMKDLLWERSENWKVDRLIYERALLEGRKEDVLKKYPQYANQIENYFTGENDPSGNNKYLSKMVKLQRFVRAIVNELPITPTQRVVILAVVKMPAFAPHKYHVAFQFLRFAEESGQQANALRIGRHVGYGYCAGGGVKIH